MFARYRTTVPNTPTGEGEAKVHVGGPFNVVVLASASEKHEKALSLEAHAEFSPKPSIARVFQDLANDTLPRRAKPYVTLTNRVEPGQPLKRHVPPPHIMPEPFQSFGAMLRMELTTAAISVARLHRWRTNHYPPERRQALGGWVEFSLDGGEWFSLPQATSARAWAKATVTCGDGMFDTAIQPMLDAGVREPLAFELLSEAAELSATSLRSALVIAVAALEVGLKTFIGQVVPEAEWLVMEAPTPPVVDILGLYLPTLSVPKTLPSGEVRPPPKATLETIKEAVARRNFVTHRGSESTFEMVDSTIGAVSDVLRLLDYYSGHEWARLWMSYEFAVALNLRERDEAMEQFLAEDAVGSD